MGHISAPLVFCLICFACNQITYIHIVLTSFAHSRRCSPPSLALAPCTTQLRGRVRTIPFKKTPNKQALYFGNIPCYPWDSLHYIVYI
ncbi:hypothetical protein BC939DRAFT_166326 [Gamsiella multidivaricata]|uniref:uncharacterized protein n=1 Tax=Gamsiella multidivaricata TaxID=101098 RepID=UPI00221F10DA|nr:uncharacterized protein BC939DRAFT_166326 [Gamsiella multidivaricata]KAI7823199.1 hypothetical protein BC939DRAFT_166326 [Gamsiella multidivaricata]